MKKIYNIKSESKKNPEIYSVVLEFDSEGNLIKDKTTCDCKHGSFYRFTKKNIAAGKWKCRHIRQALKMLENNIPDEIQKEIVRRINGSENTKTKEMEPIFQ